MNIPTFLKMVDLATMNTPVQIEFVTVDGGQWPIFDNPIPEGINIRTAIRWNPKQETPFRFIPEIEKTLTFVNGDWTTETVFSIMSVKFSPDMITVEITQHE